MQNDGCIDQTLHQDLRRSARDQLGRFYRRFLLVFCLYDLILHIRCNVFYQRFHFRHRSYEDGTNQSLLGRF